MSKRLLEKNYNCHFELTLDIIGGKWKPIIMYYIGEKKVLRYGELKKCIPSINERMLTRQLRELEEDKLINREVYREVPPRVEYSLTEVGQTVIPVLNSLRNWGLTYNDIYKVVNIEKGLKACEEE
ncbi:helix-turn-helix domain-containing protein [uncultured Clostridium sp.]|jgi:DNA-binding HxlR family transcriptional regulator|uniref:winged helix-turn-helix transcriptional regulator n=1 Tax=uncultured Clostridium sp. TaxID=59620 RepID=UPI00260768BA|nr:helix-turn-helix domain-containing protein [uncultured Clostridium sp.]